MEAPDDLDDLALRGEQLLAINRALFDGDHPEAAFHALGAALHCADDGGDVPTLRRIAAIAGEQHRRMTARFADTTTAADASAPGGLPDLGANARWGSLERLFGSLEHQADVKASTIEVHRTQAARRAAR